MDSVRPESFHFVLKLLDTALSRGLSFKECVEDFRSFFQSDEPESFRSSCRLCVFLHDGLLSPAQRLIAYVIVAELHRIPTLPVHPFTLLLLDAAEMVAASTAVDESESGTKARLNADVVVVLKLLKSAVYYEQIRDLMPTVVYNQVSEELSNNSGKLGSIGPELLSDLKSLRFEYKLHEPPPLDVMASMAIRPYITLPNSNSNTGAGTGTGMDAGADADAGAFGSWTAADIQTEWNFQQEIAKDSSLIPLQPSFVQFPPPVLDILPDELHWIEDNGEDGTADSMGGLNLVWDDSAWLNSLAKLHTDTKDKAEEESRQELLVLLQAACSKALIPRLQQDVIQYLKAHPSIILQCAVGPEQMPGLVRNNANVAAELIRCHLLIMRNSTNNNEGSSSSSSSSGEESKQSHSADYLSVLLDIGMDNQTIEVVNMLLRDGDNMHHSSSSRNNTSGSSSNNQHGVDITCRDSKGNCNNSTPIAVGPVAPLARAATGTQGVLPIEFVRQYVSMCLAACEKIPDRSLQTRFVRMVCVLLKSLVLSNLLTEEDLHDGAENSAGGGALLYVEIQTFCLTFSKVKEAVLLYQFMKSMEGHI